MEQNHDEIINCLVSQVVNALVYMRKVWSTNLGMLNLTKFTNSSAHHRFFSKDEHKDGRKTIFSVGIYMH